MSGSSDSGATPRRLSERPWFTRRDVVSFSVMLAVLVVIYALALPTLHVRIGNPAFLLGLLLCLVAAGGFGARGALGVTAVVTLIDRRFALSLPTSPELSPTAAVISLAAKFVLAGGLGRIVDSRRKVRALNAEPDELQNVRVAFVLFTVALTWVFVHTSFATHYAFEYYGRRAGDGEINGGLEFPGGQAPDFWDMWHFSVVIGLSAQTADVAIASRPLRHIATVHSICSFLFNTIILATTINFAAELFQPRGGP